MRASTLILLSMIFFSISIFFMYSYQFYRSEMPKGKEIEAEYLHHNYVIDDLDRYKIDPFDYYMSWIEESIMLLSMTFGIAFIMPVVKAACLEKLHENYKYEEKQNNKAKEKN